MDTLVSLSKLLYFIRNIIMAEFASKGVAGSGLGLGIAGTALGLLNKESYHSAEDIRKYKDAYKALYYLLSIEKANK